jgi:hypothetical protein
VAASDGKIFVLKLAVLLMRITWWHIEWFIHFKAPRAPLYRLIGRLFSKISSFGCVSELFGVHKISY